MWLRPHTIQAEGHVEITLAIRFKHNRTVSSPLQLHNTLGLITIYKLFHTFVLQSHKEWTVFLTYKNLLYLLVKSVCGSCCFNDKWRTSAASEEQRNVHNVCITLYKIGSLQDSTRCVRFFLCQCQWKLVRYTVMFSTWEGSRKWRGVNLVCPGGSPRARGADSVRPKTTRANPPLPLFRRERAQQVDRIWQ